MYELCRYLLASGRRCTQPAVTGVPYCRHHGVVKRTVASSILPPEFQHLHRALPFLYPEDRASIQANCFLVMRALDDRRISTQTANAMNRLLRTCQANLKRGPLHESDAYPADVILSEVDADRRQQVEGPASSQPNSGPGSALSGEQADVTEGALKGTGFSPSVKPSQIDGALAPEGTADNASPKGSLSDKKTDPAIVRRVILTPIGEELAPPLEIWEQDEEPHHRAAAPAPHHPDCRCGQCPTTPENNNTGAPSFRAFCERVGESEPLPTDVIPSAVDAEGGNEVEESAVSSSPENSHEDDDPYAFYEGDPIPPDPYAVEETEEERKQDLERREQILDKHKDRLAKVEKQYLYTPQLADRLREEIQQIMELEMGHEAFSYQLLPPPAS